MPAAHIADTGFFVALGAPDNDRYRHVRAFAERNELTFLIPERVYDELTTGALDRGSPPIDTAFEQGWVDVADALGYSIPLVSKTMDGLQRYIASADDRHEHEVERADAALGGLAAQLLAEGSTTTVYIYTPDIAAGEGIETVFESEGYGDAVTFVNAFQFIEDLEEV
jgi:hypothetical protein